VDGWGGGHWTWGLCECCLSLKHVWVYGAVRCSAVPVVGRGRAGSKQDRPAFGGFPCAACLEEEPWVHFSLFLVVFFCVVLLSLCLAFGLGSVSGHLSFDLVLHAHIPSLERYHGGGRWGSCLMDLSSTLFLPCFASLFPLDQSASALHRRGGGPPVVL